MKRNKLVSQFQIHMIVTVAILAVVAAFAYFKIEEQQNIILPNKTAVYVDITSTYADGTKDTETYSVDLENSSQPKNYEKKNDLSEHKNSKSETLSIESDASDTVLIIDKSKFQTGTSVSISGIKDGLSMLNEKDQSRYKLLEKLKYIIPMTSFVFGILLSCYIFYRRQMKHPITVMADAAKKISGNNLDFVITSETKNELGQLCDSFEKMRVSLVESNKEMLKMMDDKKKLQVSVAHDLRNPIAIMKGYIEMMDEEIKSNDISEESLSESVNTLIGTVDRMECYVDSINLINHLEEMKLSPVEMSIEKSMDTWEKDLSILGKQQGIRIEFNSSIVPNTVITLDYTAVSRILENIIDNSCRYAKEKIVVTLSMENKSEMTIDIADDGPGYPKKILQNPELFFFTTEHNSGHTGMGMTICKLLCKKHGGFIRFINGTNGGARAIIKLKVDGNLTF